MAHGSVEFDVAPYKFNAPGHPLLHTGAASHRAIWLPKLGFIDFALGRIDAQLCPLPPPHRAADVVIVDQNILLDGMPHMYGSVIVEQRSSFREHLGSPRRCARRRSSVT